MIEAILAGLAGWRIASLLVNEDGPFDVFARLRHRVGIREGEPYDDNVLTGVLSCVWCCSVWTAGLSYAVAEWWAVWPVALVAATGIAAAIHANLEK